MSETLNKLVSVIDSLLEYSKESHDATVKNIELKLSNNELLDLFAAKLAGINNPPFITTESINTRLTALEEGFNKSISKTIADVQDSFNSKLDNLNKSWQEDIRKIAIELSGNEPKLQSMQQKQDAALQSVKNDFNSKMTTTENKLLNIKAQATQSSIEALSESTKLKQIENTQSIQEKLATEFRNSLEVIKSDSNIRFKLIADLLTDAKLPMIGGIFKDKHEVIKQLIVDTHTQSQAASLQPVRPATPSLVESNEDTDQNGLFELLWNSLSASRFKSVDKKDEFIIKLKKATQDSKPKKTLDGMNFGAYLDIDKKNWTEIVDAAIHSAGKK